MFIIERKPHGYVNKYRARLVAKGYLQHLGYVYSKAFNVTVKPTIIIFVLTLAVSKGWCLGNLTSPMFLWMSFSQKIKIKNYESTKWIFEWGWIWFGLQD